MENSEKIELRAYVLGVNGGDDVIFQYQMNEIHNLCSSLDIIIVEDIIQNLSTPNPATYIGSGKLEELCLLAKTEGVDLIVVNDELTPAQLRNMTEVLTVEVMDRTMLILKIFEERAQTKEASLQVEIANLNYLLPRLAGSYNNLSRTGGGGGGASGARRGGGETKLELDKRKIEKRIVKAKEELALIVDSRKTSRKARTSNQVKTVAFVGYTNAGKSSTINKLLSLYGNTEKGVFVKDMLFATLDTTTRKIKLPNNDEFLITDTVGFVSKLPHHLVESFKSTLEEITEADYIVHIVDASSPFLDLQMKTTIQVLDELGVSGIPVLYAYNKIDKVANKFLLPHNYNPYIYLSSVDETGYNELIEAIEKELFSDFTISTLLLPYDKGDIYAYLKENTEVYETTYTEDGILVVAKLTPYMVNLYRIYMKESI